MNKPTRKPATARRPHKQPRDPRRAQGLVTVEELGVYTPNYQVDPWRGQLMQLSWDYCV